MNAFNFHNQEQSFEDDEFDRMVDQVLGFADSTESTSVAVPTLDAPFAWNASTLVNPSIVSSTFMAPTPPNTMISQTTSRDNGDGDEEEEIEKPKRSLSSYNIFFAAERKKLLQSLPARKGKKKPRNSHGKLGFAEMARTISAKWKKITPEEKSEFDELAKLDGVRYRNEMAIYKQKQQLVALSKMQAAASSLNSSPIAGATPLFPSSQFNLNPVMYQQPPL